MAIEFTPGESKVLDVKLVPTRIGVSIYGSAGVSHTVMAGESKTYEWLQAWSAEEATIFAKSGHAIFPWAWMPSAYAAVGLKRGILFFDTTGWVGDMALHLWNSIVSGPGYYGGSHDFCILSGNGADPNFGKEIYGWIRTRFSDEYLITRKRISSIPCQSWGTFDIPAQFVNSSGYTVLICVVDNDFLGDSDPTGSTSGSIGSYLYAGKSYVSRY